MKNTISLKFLLLLLICGFFSGIAFAENTWSGMLIVDKSSSIHADAAREPPILGSPLIVHVDENSKAYKDGFRSGDYIMGTADKEINSTSELETIIDKKSVPLKIQGASGVKVITFSPSPVTPDVEAYFQIRGFVRSGKAKDNLEKIGSLAKEHSKNPLVQFMAAFAFSSAKEKDKANACLNETVKLAGGSALAKISRKRLPKDYKEKPAPLSGETSPDNKQAGLPDSGKIATSTEKDDPNRKSGNSPEVAETTYASDPKSVASETPAEVGGSIDQKAFAAASLEQKIAMVRAEIEKNPVDKWLKNSLSNLLMKKVEGMKSKSVEELEPIVKEAMEIAPDPFKVKYAWGCILYDRKNYDASIPNLEEANRLAPEHLDCMVKLGFALVFSSKFEEAIPPLDKARKVLPKDFPILFYLGRSYKETKDFEKAVEVFEEALPLARSDKETEMVKRLIFQAKEHGASSEGSTKDENQRFIVQYAGDSQKDLGEVTMEILEETYDQVCSDLNYKPEVKISVLFFRTEDFYKQNKTPQWAGAFARGEKIMVPLREGYTNINSVKGILAHEFTHVIINLKTNQRCPTWIHEGLAVYEENKAAYGDPNQLRPDYEKCFRETIQTDKKIFPLNQIQLDYRTQGGDVSVMYVESYLAMRFMIEKWNWTGVNEMLTAVNEGSHLENAIEQATERSMADFQKEFIDWLQGVQ